MKGTPKSIDQAIKNGIALARISDSVAVIREHTKDFLAQKFGPVMMSENPEVVQAVTELWNSLFPEDKR